MKRGHVVVSRIRAEGGLWVFTCRCGYQTPGHELRHVASDAMSSHVVNANTCTHPLLARYLHEGTEDWCEQCGTWITKESA